MSGAARCLSPCSPGDHIVVRDFWLIGAPFLRLVDAVHFGLDVDDGRDLERAETRFDLRPRSGALDLGVPSSIPGRVADEAGAGARERRHAGSDLELETHPLVWFDVAPAHQRRMPPADVLRHRGDGDVFDPGSIA